LAHLRELLGELLGQRHVYFAPSGRSAIARLLTLLPYPEVVVPAYTCTVVKDAAIAAGKRIIFVDAAKGGVNATAAEFEKEAKPGRILIATHLFGIPTDIEAICQLAKERGCLTIEDAAAAFASERNGRHLGTFADFGVYSFEHSKRLPAIRGGAIVVNNHQYFDPGKLENANPRSDHRSLPSKELIFSLIHNAATAPWLYGRLVLPLQLKQYLSPTAGPFNHTQTAVLDDPAYSREFHPYQAQLVVRMLGRRQQIRRHIAQLVSIYEKALRESSVATFLPSERDDAALLRYPVAFPARPRAEVLRQALARGMYLETNFEQLLPAVGERDRFPNAVWAAGNIILLPLYRSLSFDDASGLAERVKGLTN